MASSGIPARIKNNIKDLLLSKFEGVPMSEFLSDYSNLHREILKFRDFGFSSLPNFIKAMPDIARVMTTDEFGCRIFVVGEPDSYRPAAPAENQDSMQNRCMKTPKGELFSHMNGITSLQSPPIIDDNFVPDKLGLWSVCLPVHLCPSKKSEALKAIFSQAGDVIQTNFTQKWAFFRYAKKEQALLALQLFDYLEVRIPDSNKREKHRNGSEKRNENTNGFETDGISYDRASAEIYETLLSNDSNRKKLQPDVSGALFDRQISVEADSHRQEKIYGKCHRDENLNGYQSEQEFQNGLTWATHPQLKLTDKERRPHSFFTETGIRSPGKTCLFVRNIESEDDFRELIRPYHPVSVSVRTNKDKLIAFIKMSTEEDARRAIENLNDRWQKTKYMQVFFDRMEARSDSDSISDESTMHSYGARPKTRINRKPALETEFADMPPLIHLSKLGSDAENYILDCCIYVTNFPDNILESVLRNAFVKHHVLDVYIVNNSSTSDCTGAFLYLVSVYDVIQAVIDMDGSCIFGKPIKVNVPYKNTILRTVVENERAKHSASSLTYPAFGNNYL